VLQHTFLHLPGVGPATELFLWEQGVLTWRDALQRPEPAPERCRLAGLRCGLEESLRYLGERDACYFQQRLPSREQWRLLGDFADRAVCLDIETTGLSWGSSYITVVGLYDGREYRAFVRGQNLDRLPAELRRYGVAITYNGSRFDIPFLQAELGPLPEGLAHVDVMYPLRRLGHGGGLKSVERQTGLARPSSLGELDGFDAVRLWHLHRRGHRGALQTLVRYNAEDVMVLLPLASLVYNSLASELPLSAPVLPAPEHPRLDLPYDAELVEWLGERKVVG
jgi:uncharacterized protein YprB with RNaseH-like and TPR domain